VVTAALAPRPRHLTQGADPSRARLSRLGGRFTASAAYIRSLPWSRYSSRPGGGAVTAGIAVVPAPVESKPTAPLGVRIPPERVVAPIIPDTAGPGPARRLPWFAAESDYRSEAVNSRHAASGTLDATIFGCIRSS
jgi:hypothetical protein